MTPTGSRALRPVRPKDRFLIFGSPAIEEDEIREVVASMRSGWLGTGPKVARFEEDFCNYKRAPFAVSESRARGRGDCQRAHLLRHGERDRSRRPQAGAGGRGTRQHEHGSCPGGGEAHPPDPGHSAGPFRRLAVRHGRARGHRRETRSQDHRGLRPRHRDGVQVWQRYDQAFADLPVRTPPEPEPHARHGRHLYAIPIDERRAGISRDDFLNAMTHHNIGVGVHYLQPARAPLLSGDVLHNRQQSSSGLTDTGSPWRLRLRFPARQGRNENTR